KTEAQAVAAAELLIASGANVNARDNGGQTALHGAAGWGYNNVVNALAAHKIDLMAQDARGPTAAAIAKGAASSSGRAAAQAHPETEALLRKLMTQTNALTTARD